MSISRLRIRQPALSCIGIAWLSAIAACVSFPPFNVDVAGPLPPPLAVVVENAEAFRARANPLDSAKIGDVRDSLTSLDGCWGRVESRKPGEGLSDDAVAGLALLSSVFGFDSSRGDLTAYAVLQFDAGNNTLSLFSLLEVDPDAFFEAAIYSEATYEVIAPNQLSVESTRVEWAATNISSARVDEGDAIRGTLVRTSRWTVTLDGEWLLMVSDTDGEPHGAIYRRFDCP